MRPGSLFATIHNFTDPSSHHHHHLHLHVAWGYFHCPRTSKGCKEKQLHLSSVYIVTNSRRAYVMMNGETDVERNENSSQTNHKNNKNDETAAEEIAKQHAEAVKIVQAGILYNTEQSQWNNGEIPLSFKQRPVVDSLEESQESTNGTTVTAHNHNSLQQQRPEADDDGEDDRNSRPPLTHNSSNIPCWSSRGTADVSALQSLVRTGYNQRYQLKVSQKDINHTKQQQEKEGSSSSSTLTCENFNYWDPVHAAVYNVPIQRKSHDAWGIPKIVLLFCDDFCQDLYELPWWWRRRREEPAAIDNSHHANANSSSSVTCDASSNNNITQHTNNNETDNATAPKSAWEAAVQPVLSVLNISSSQVVRLLLASLPSGTTIPVHHDTGEWVKFTHRIHVPIVVNDASKILFRCGPNASTLEAIPCHPGHVFEINNQAKHTVSNCDVDPFYRVHLILDYVDESFLLQQQQQKKRQRHPNSNSKRIRLQPGEVLMQTRRSIDRLACKGQRPTPSFMILGAQKAGTTFLFELIMQHPLLVKPKDGRRETHCLDWRWKDSLQTTMDRRKWCQQFFYLQELELHPSLLTGDSTPSYLLDSVRVIPRIQEVFPWKLKFFVMFRDPIIRAESHYAMVTSTQGTPAQLKARGSEWRNRSLDQVIALDIFNMKSCGLLPYWTCNNNGDDLTTDWLNASFDQATFDSFSGSHDEDAAWNRYLHAHVPLQTGSYGLLSRGLYELQLRPWLRAFDPSDFLILELETMNANEANLSASLQRAWDHLNIPVVDFGEWMDTTPKNTREYSRSMSCATLDFLAQFYRPHTERFRVLLADMQQRNHVVATGDFSSQCH